MDIKNQAAVITGGGSGLGLATALHLHELGARVSVLDLRVEDIKKSHPELLALQADVTSEQSIESAFQQAEQQHGACRVLINCAGVAPAKRVVGKQGPMALDAFSQVININLIGTFNCIRIAAAQMTGAEPLNTDGERGVIINTASVAATDGQLGQAAYSASKAGVIGMALPIARELSRFGIRINTIAPGIFKTPMMAAMPEAVQSELAASIPFPKRMGQPGEYADLVFHLINNSMINAEVIRLDGAIRMV